ncbi:ankyrin repeat-containing domain protein [Amanita rubescens]|nr:ankyrin repeat-containing domain protein [Amanita rubescens]KAF8335286.1 ankyrin repeat-containing domain protein [Amanita rubescens]
MDINIKESTFIDVGHDYIKHHHETTNNINVININAEELLAKLKKWLNVPDPSVSHNNAREKHLEGSGQWLLRDKRYIKWKEQSNSFMWINGISGCGKTLICKDSSTIIEDIKAIVEAQPETGLAYFYFDINDKTKQTSRSLISSLLLNLTAKSNNYVSMNKLYHKHDKLSLPTKDELLSLLMELLQGFEQTYVVIDALDECDDDYCKLFDTVIKVIHKWKLPHFHLLVTSRRERDIIMNMEELVPTELHLSAELVGSDIISYINSAVENDSGLKRWSPEIQGVIKNSLISGANGMFRWVACQIEELKHCPSQKVLMETLKSLPKDLETTYDQILQRIDEKQILFAKVILQWLMLGMRPLGLEELAIVVTFDTSSGNFDSNMGLAHPDDVIHMCSSLVIKTDDNKVQLAHASVKEYFLHKPRQITLSDVQLGHAAISHCCLSYILLPSESEGQHIFIFDYPAEFWSNHYQLSNKNEILQDLAKRFLWDQHGAFKRWGRQNDNHAALWLEDIYTGPSPLHYAALFGLQDIIETTIQSNKMKMTRNKWSWAYIALVEIASENGYIGIVRLLLDKGVKVNAQGVQYGNALQATSWGGHVEISRLLLDKAANVNAQGGKYGNALQAASLRGNAEIARLLLDKGANMNAQGGKYGNALQAASYGGDAEIARLLLDKGANVNAQGGKYGNALQAASYTGHAEIAKLLLDKGANVNAQGGKYGNALQAASWGGNAEISRLLLDKGAIVNAQGGKYGNALQAVSLGENAEIARLLLEKGANVNAQGGWFGNALQAASWRGNAEIAMLLLDKGADVNAQGGEYGNALQAVASSWEGQAKIARLLLDKGANVNAQGGKYGNALQAASWGGNAEISRLLLDKGADANAQSGQYGNALQAAAYRGDAEIARLLLDKGANVNAQGGKYGNALQAASWGGNAEISRLLLDKGAIVNAQGGKYGNALQAASWGENAEIVMLLLDKGANVNAQGGEYGNALQAASQGRNAKIARLLLDKGANVNAQGGKYGNALQAASYTGHAEVARLLLDKGANVNAQGGEYGSASQAASWGGNAEIVMLLLDKGADVNAQGGQYGNALQAASWGGNAEIAMLLLDKGADVNAQGGLFGNALHAASEQGNAETIKILLDNGAQSGQSEVTEDKVWKKMWNKLHKFKVTQKPPHLKF